MAARKATLFNTKVVQSDTNPALAIQSSDTYDVLVDIVVASNTGSSTRNYKMLVAESNETAAEAIEIKSATAITAHTAAIGNLA